MVDLHCHILPGLDDGPILMEESVEMAEAAIAGGVTHLVATPHSNSKYFFDYPKIRALCKELQDLVGERLKLATGCDFHLNPENIESLREHASQFCINQKDYLLVEFNEIAIPPGIENTFHEMHLAGLRPIITHPERNRLLRKRTELGVVEKGFGEEKARALFVENPLAAFEGRELPHVPELEAEEPGRKKRFFIF
jgi:protein-tyrosine phosphatase